MSRAVSAVAFLIVALAPAGAYAEVYKCTEADGRKVYQDRPCKADQQAETYDPTKSNVTTIDSEAARREAQGALVTREAGRDEPDTDEGQPVVYEPDYLPVPVYQPEPVYYPYPVYGGHGYGRGRGHDHHDHDGPRIPQRPDETPMSRPQRGGGGYVPAPPTIREVAPRPPASPRGRASRERDER